LSLTQLSILFLFLHPPLTYFLLFFFNHPAPTEIYTLSLHDALPISLIGLAGEVVTDYVLRLKRELGERGLWVAGYTNEVMAYIPDRKSTRLNSSHSQISYAVFCLKKKKKKKNKNINNRQK